MVMRVGKVPVLPCTAPVRPMLRLSYHYSCVSNRLQFQPLFASKNDPLISRVKLAEKATAERSRDMVWGGRG